MTQIPLIDLAGNAIFHDVLRGKAGLVNNSIPTPEFAARRAATGIPRTRLVSLLEDSTQGYELSSSQQRSLESLKNPTSVVVTTGQQIGFLGGPLYTLLKICSMVKKAEELSKQLAIDVVPVFWLEDNDHDAAEASTTTLLDKAGALQTISHWDQIDPRLPVSERTLNANDVEVVKGALALLGGQFADEVRQRCAELYAKGTRWSDAFLGLIWPILQEWGVLVVRGSHIIADGKHAALVVEEFMSGTKLTDTLNERSTQLQADGYAIQATVPDALFFVHDGGRQRLEKTESGFSTANRTYSSEELAELAKTTPQQFSPSVLARPLVQDTILPTICSVLGAAEVAYHAQITPLYEAFGIEQPYIAVRHHTVLLDKKTERNLSKAGSKPQDYFSNWEVVEQRVASELVSDTLPSTDGVDALMEPFRAVIPAIDATLTKKVEATASEITSALEALNGKARAALKREHQTLIQRHNAIWTFINPNGMRNERVYPLAMWMSLLGITELRIIVEMICSQPSSMLTIVGPSNVEQN